VGKIIEFKKLSAIKKFMKTLLIAALLLFTLGCAKDRTCTIIRDGNIYTMRYDDGTVEKHKIVRPNDKIDNYGLIYDNGIWVKITRIE
jgi:hypothetical protein